MHEAPQSAVSANFPPFTFLIPPTRSALHARRVLTLSVDAIVDEAPCLDDQKEHIVRGLAAVCRHGAVQGADEFFDFHCVEVTPLRNIALVNPKTNLWVAGVTFRNPSLVARYPECVQYIDRVGPAVSMALGHFASALLHADHDH